MHVFDSINYKRIPF